MERAPQIAVVGAASCDAEMQSVAERVGRRIALRGATLICGGRGGVMEAASRGAADVGGLTVGILPSYEWGAANSYLRIVLPTGLGHARNAVVVAAGDAVVALPGAHGTLSEIALALKLGRPVVGVRAWRELEGVDAREDPEAAVDSAYELALRRLAAR